MTRQSDLEISLIRQCRMIRLPAPVTELRFAPPRRWRFDLAFPDRMLAVEIDGGIYTAGRHNRGAGYEADVEKGNAAVLAGWRVLHVTGHMVEDGRALTLIETALNQPTRREAS